MDELEGLLEGVRARGAFVLRSVFDPPWSLLIRDRAPLTVLVVVRGGCWIRHDVTADVTGTGSEGVRLAQGDVALLRGPDPYVVADPVDAPPTVVVHPGQVCTDPDGVSVSAEMALGVRTWGSSRDGGTVLLTGVYTGEGEVARRTLQTLPRLALLRREDWSCPYVPLLAAEAQVDAPGQGLVLDRLLDVLLLQALQAWFRRAGVAPGWYAAQADPVVGPAVRAMHADPARPWTVALLAREAGVSRALLARRFAELVGEPPMSYLTGWRLTLAADLLADPAVTVTAAARRVGYASPFTFSAAYKRRFGCSPSEYRSRREQYPAGAAVAEVAAQVSR